MKGNLKQMLNNVKCTSTVKRMRELNNERIDMLERQRENPYRLVGTATKKQREIIRLLGGLPNDKLI